MQYKFPFFLCPGLTDVKTNSINALQLHFDHFTEDLVKYASSTTSNMESCHQLSLYNTTTKLTGYDRFFGCKLGQINRKNRLPLILLPILSVTYPLIAIFFARETVY